MSSSDAKAVRRHAAQHDLFNRLHSISADEAFVQNVATKWFGSRFEVIANQRCGTWYCDPKTTSKHYAYFKSTDGHIHQWDFNLRRSNLALAEHVEAVGGIILVDSTRRGKRMPDGLSKTVPVWCAVINSTLGFSTSDPSSSSSSDDLFLPAFISPSERSQIASLIPAFTTSLLSSVLPLPKLSKPLRPFFIHPSTSQPPLFGGTTTTATTNSDGFDSLPYTPVICLSASRFEEDVIPTATKVGKGFWARTVAFEYVPGAGDDDELWGRGLTPALYHANKDELLSTARDDLPEFVDSLVEATQYKSAQPTQPTQTASSSQKSQSTSTNKDSDIPDISALSLSLPSATPLTPYLALDIGPPIRPVASLSSSSLIYTLTVIEVETKPAQFFPSLENPTFTSTGPSPSKGTLYLPSARSMPREYHKALIAAISHVRAVSTILDQRTIVIRPSRTDLSSRRAVVGLAVALLCAIPSLGDPSPVLPTDEEDAGKQATNTDNTSLDNVPTPVETPVETEGEVKVDKSVVADRLHAIVALWPDANPSRAALRRINEILMSPLPGSQ